MFLCQKKVRRQPFFYCLLSHCRKLLLVTYVNLHRFHLVITFGTCTSGNGFNVARAVAVCYNGTCSSRFWWTFWRSCWRSRSRIETFAHLALTRCRACRSVFNLQNSFLSSTSWTLAYLSFRRRISSVSFLARTRCRAGYELSSSTFFHEFFSWGVRTTRPAAPPSRLTTVVVELTIVLRLTTTGGFTIIVGLNTTWQLRPHLKQVGT